MPSKVVTGCRLGIGMANFGCADPKAQNAQASQCSRSQHILRASYLDRDFAACAALSKPIRNAQPSMFKKTFFGSSFPVIGPAIAATSGPVLLHLKCRVPLGWMTCTFI